MTLPQLPLDRPLVFFDLETTGVNVVTDRIVQIAALRYEPGGEEPQRLKYLVNPGVPIPAETTAVHGITDDMVADEAPFADIADEIADFFINADIGGYNVARFDLPLLMEEFARCGRTFDASFRRRVDVQEIFFRLEPRTLAGALRFYCGRELEDAHDAMADIEATVQVLAGQLERYTPDGRLTADVEALHALSERPGQLDSTNRLRKDDNGEILINFGKYQGQPLRKVFARDPNYYHWIQDRDFSIEVKQITREVWEAMSSR